MRKMAAIATKGPLKGFDEKSKDLAFWLCRTPQERAAAVTTLIRQSMVPGQRMVRIFTGRRKMHP